ncbi:MAG: HK97 gp10 family phage protein [Armatimonadota bacterium]
MIKVELLTLGPEWQLLRSDELERDFERALAQLLGLWVRRLAAEAKKLAPVDKGQLRASIVGEVFRRANQILGVVGTNLKHGFYQEFGTGIHSVWPGAPKQRIRPKNGKALKIPIGNFRNLKAVDAEAVDAVESRGKHAVTAYLFRGSIAGAKPQPFLTKLLEKYAAQIEADLLRLAQKHGFR